MSAKEEVKNTIERFFQAMDIQDLAAIEALIPRTDTTVHVGTDKGEIWKGWDVLNEATKEQFEGLEYYKADIRDLTINIAPSQNVAWYFHLLDAEIKSNGHLTRWKGARFTGVLEKQNDRWVLSQTHVSIPESA
jgi:ketosteroid isomerase-like protein